MKTTDHNVENLRRSLRDEANVLRQRAKRLDALATNVKEQVRSGIATVHTFEFVAQEAIDIVTHRSNIHPQTIARVCASLAADAAVEWANNQTAAERLHAELGHICESGDAPNCGHNPCVVHCHE